MLALCQHQAARDGLAPRLYQQAMHELDLPRAYRTIYICDSFGIGGDRRQDAEALRRCHRHLAPGRRPRLQPPPPLRRRRGVARLAAGGSGGGSRAVAGGRGAAPGATTGTSWRCAAAGRPRPIGAATDAPDPRRALAGRAPGGGGGAHPAGEPLLPQRAAAAAGPGGVRGRHRLRGLHRRGGYGGRHFVVFVAHKDGYARG